MLKYQSDEHFPLQEYVYSVNSFVHKIICNKGTIATVSWTKYLKNAKMSIFSVTNLPVSRNVPR